MKQRSVRYVVWKDDGGFQFSSANIQLISSVSVDLSLFLLSLSIWVEVLFPFYGFNRK